MPIEYREPIFLDHPVPRIYLNWYQPADADEAPMEEREQSPQPREQSPQPREQSPQPREQSPQPREPSPSALIVANNGDGGDQSRTASPTRKSRRIAEKLASSSAAATAGGSSEASRSGSSSGASGSGTKRRGRSSVIGANRRAGNNGRDASAAGSSARGANQRTITKPIRAASVRGLNRSVPPRGSSSGASSSAQRPGSSSRKTSLRNLQNGMTGKSSRLSTATSSTRKRNRAGDSSNTDTDDEMSNDSLKGVDDSDDDYSDIEEKAKSIKGGWVFDARKTAILLELYKKDTNPSMKRCLEIAEKFNRRDRGNITEKQVKSWFVTRKKGPDAARDNKLRWRVAHAEFKPDKFTKMNALFENAFNEDPFPNVQKLKKLAKPHNYSYKEVMQWFDQKRCAAVREERPEHAELRLKMHAMHEAMKLASFVDPEVFLESFKVFKAQHELIAREALPEDLRAKKRREVAVAAGAEPWPNEEEFDDGEFRGLNQGLLGAMNHREHQELRMGAQPIDYEIDEMDDMMEYMNDHEPVDRDAARDRYVEVMNNAEAMVADEVFEVDNEQILGVDGEEVHDEGEFDEEHEVEAEDREELGDEEVAAQPLMMEEHDEDYIDVDN